MIGVHTSESLRPFAEEFFQLFKTPWEFHCSGRHYEVVVCCGVLPASYLAQLVLIYEGTEAQDENHAVVPGRGNETEAAFLTYREDRIPIYTNQAATDCSIAFQVDERALSGNGRATTVARIGYNLFLEIAFLLTDGQPPENAMLPAVELHIDLLRDLMLRYTEYLIEIPAQPAGYSLIACLTHDVDHPSLRKSHVWPTVLGFLYRALLGSVIDVFRGRKNFNQLLTNWRAAASLPFIYAGLDKDIWDSFHAYNQLEGTRPSTYFFIPTKGRPGKDRDGVEHAKRAAAYAAPEFSSTITSLQREGREIGIHGVDSWCDVSAGTQERQTIADLTGETRLGVRMHWLYFDNQSPSNLERAGYDYDSTVGYNDTIGYRAGTTQAFKPLSVSQILELPLHIMDTALFYRSYLDLKPEQAICRISEMVSQTKRVGGALTINWHDRSLAPERLWGGVYRNIIKQLTDAGAWFATGRDAVSWFRQRRSISFESVRVDGDQALCISIRRTEAQQKMPPARVRIHRGKNARFGDGADVPYLDYEIRESAQDFHVPMQFTELKEVCA